MRKLAEGGGEAAVAVGGGDKLSCEICPDGWWEEEEEKVGFFFPPQNCIQKQKVPVPQSGGITARPRDGAAEAARATLSLAILMTSAALSAAI